MAAMVTGTRCSFCKDSYPSSMVAALLRTSSLSGFSPKFSPALWKLSLMISLLPPRRQISFCFQENSVAIPREQRWMYEESEINGPDIWNKTWYPKEADHVTTKKTWYIVDATDKILGRMASTIAMHIRGKDLVSYTPSVDMGAFVIVASIMETLLAFDPLRLIRKLGIVDGLICT